MHEDELTGRAIESLEQKRRSAATTTAAAVACATTIAVWGLTGAGYFWPGWVLIAVALVATAFWIRAGLDRPFNDYQVRYEVSRLRGGPPPGVQR